MALEDHAAYRSALHNKLPEEVARLRASQSLNKSQRLNKSHSLNKVNEQANINQGTKATAP